VNGLRAGTGKACIRHFLFLLTVTLEGKSNFINKENKMSYVHPEYLVETEWVAAHLNDPEASALLNPTKIHCSTPSVTSRRGAGGLVHHLAASAAPRFPHQRAIRRSSHVQPSALDNDT
jgi:hypothetical protein